MDISMCTGDNCQLKEKCLRFTGPKGIWQSYSAWPGNTDKTCEGFVDNSNYGKENHKKK